MPQGPRCGSLATTNLPSTGRLSDEGAAPEPEGQSPRIYQFARATAAIAVGAMLSKAVGFAREMSIAARFGASGQVDAYVIASSIPGLLFAEVGAALGTVVVPLFTRKLVKEGRPAAFRMAETVWNVVVLMAAAATALGEVFMPQIVRVLAPGFGGQGPVFRSAVLLGRIMMPATFFTGISLLARGMMYSLRAFALPAFADPLQNLVVVASIFTLGVVLGIRGVAIGTLVGMSVPLLLFWTYLARRGFRPAPRINWKLPELRQIGILTLPVLVGSGLGTINALVDRMLASGLPEGNIAAMNYSTRIYNLPMVLFGASLGTVLYPTLAMFAASSQHARIVSGIRRGVSVGSLLLFPMAAGIIVLAAPITRVVYERGAFDATATGLTAGILAMYALGVPAVSWRDVCARAFYAEGDTRTPLNTSAVAVSLNVVLNLILVRFMGARGLALATSISAWVGATSLMWLWDRKHAGRRGPPRPAPAIPRLTTVGLLVETAKVAAATLAMAGAVRLAWARVALPRVRAGGGGALIVLLWLLVAATAGAVLYFGLAWLLGVRDLRFLIGAALRRVQDVASRVSARLFRR